MSLVYDATWISAPDLLIPGRKPASMPLMIDNNHNLALGLDYVQLFSENGAVDLVGDLTPIINNFDIKGSDRGSVLETNGSSGPGNYFNSQYDKTWSSSDLLSIFLIVKTSDTLGTLASQRDGTSIVWQLYTTATAVLFNPGGQSIIGVTEFNNSDLFDGNFHSVGVSCDYSVGYLGYGDGMPSVDGLNPASIPNASSIPLSIGHRWQGFPGNAYQTAGDFICLYLWRNRLLTAEDHFSLYQDPFQFLIPAIG